MKKIKNIFIITLMCIMAVSLSSCTFKKSNNSKIAEKKVEKKEIKKFSVKDYFPFISNSNMVYEGKGSEYASKEVYVDYINGNRIQLREETSGTVIGKVLEVKDGELRVVFTKPEFYYRDNLMDAIDSGKIEPSMFMNDVILKEPIKVGNKWSNYQGKTREITAIDKEVQIPIGKYKAVEVTTFDGDYKTRDYYVAELGHIKSEYDSKDMKVTTILSKIIHDKPVSQDVKFYYPKYYEESNTEGLVYKEEKTDFRTNMELKDIFEKNFKKKFEEDKNIMNVMSDNTSVNYIYLNDEEKKACIDFSIEFVKEMNAGTTKESLVLQAVTNSVGNYYGVNKVYISIDGRPYESGHIILTEKDYFQVDLKNCKKLE
ncbi:GerMN domain-containing protein [Haloimpatiens sp. FM7315]|uniref:GerMN domain-containing protein n=1 Tax=Haloimpatiens sp. FM7315 TaxID=3298609 RepID=UPI00370B6AFB